MAPTRSSRRHTITKSTRAGPVSARDTGTGTGTGTGTDTGKGYSPSPGPGSGLGSGTGTRTGTRQATRLRVRTPGNIDGDTPSARKVGVVDTNAVHTKTSNCGGSDLDRQLPTDSIVDMDMDVDMDMTVDIDAEVDVDVKPVLSPSPSPPASLPLVTSSPRTIPLVPLPPRLPLELQISQSQPVLQPKLEPLSPAPEEGSHKFANSFANTLALALGFDLALAFAPVVAVHSASASSLVTAKPIGKDTHNNYPSSGAEAFQEVQPRRRLNLVLAPLMPGSFITIILLTPTPLTPTRDPTSTSRPTGKPAITRVRSGTQPSSLSHRIANWLMRTLCHSRQCTRPHITGITGIRTPSTTPTRTDRMTRGIGSEIDTGERAQIVVTIAIAVSELLLA
ncbi:hypothetical protein EHS25_008265 [Saitozyma podzolica]|uniref:Uncharacterized protein n=1 Tax=Saitozyma podzolica TaxID=1890683 RepID=A0A427YP25_9TREE|nr:hypothetical protein EHS25_008265 [Saitozyma podzolica]